jgi:tRNA(fMet)-specific endonuclease VapC
LEHKRVVVDTTIIIEYLRKENKEETTFWKLINSYDKCIVSTVTVFELYSGAKSTQHRKAIDKILEFLEVYSFEYEEAKEASKVYLELKQKNKLIEFRDIFIASCAMIQNIPLATLNHKHFKRIVQLKLLLKQ